MPKKNPSNILDYVELKNRGEVEKYLLQVVFQKDKPDLIREIPDVDQYFEPEIYHLLKHLAQITNTNW